MLSSDEAGLEAAREYDRKAEKFSKSGQVDAKAREALDGPEALELREAEKIGKQHAK